MPSTIMNKSSKKGVRDLIPLIVLWFYVVNKRNTTMKFASFNRQSPTLIRLKLNFYINDLVNFPLSPINHVSWQLLKVIKKDILLEILMVTNQSKRMSLLCYHRSKKCTLLFLNLKWVLSYIRLISLNLRALSLYLNFNHRTWFQSKFCDLPGKDAVYGCLSTSTYNCRRFLLSLSSYVISLCKTLTKEECINVLWFFILTYS